MSADYDRLARGLARTARHLAEGLTVEMRNALRSVWTDREGVTRVDNTRCTKATQQALASHGLVHGTSFALTDMGRAVWEALETIDKEQGE